LGGFTLGRYTKKVTVSFHELEDRELIEYLKEQSKEIGFSAYMRNLLRKEIDSSHSLAPLAVEAQAVEQEKKVIRKTGSGGIKIVVGSSLKQV
jgi:hypothetical protein